MSQSWAPAAGRARSVHRLVHPPGQAPGNAKRSPVGTRGVSETRWLEVDRAYGASGTGKWKWFSQTQAPPMGEARSSGRPSGPGGLRRGLGRPETCLAVGRCDLSRGQPCQAGRAALLSEGRREREQRTHSPTRPCNGGPGRGHSPQAPPPPGARALPHRSQVGGWAWKAAEAPPLA